MDIQIIERFKIFQKQTNNYLDLEIDKVIFEYLSLEKISKNQIKGGGTPDTKISENWSDDFSLVDNVNYFGWRNIEKEQFEKKNISEYSKVITKKGLETSSTWLVPKNSILIAIASASKGLVVINSVPMCINQNILGVVVGKEYKVEYIYYSLKHIYHNLEGKNEFGNLTKGSEEKRIISIPKPLNDKYTSLKIQEILIEFIEYHVNRNKWNLEIMNNVSGMIEQLDQNVLPNFFKKEKSVSLKFDTFCKKNGYDLKLSEIDFNETKIDEIVNFKGGKSSYSKPYFSNVDNLGEYEVFTGSLNPVEKIKCINMTDVINEESVSFNKDNDAGSKAFYHNKPYIVGGHHYAVFVKENKKEEIFIKYLYFTFKNLFDNNMFYQSKEPRANSGVIKDFLVKFPKGTNGLTSIEVQKIIVQFIESYLSQIAIMKTATENLKRYFVSHSETIINKTCKL